MDRARLLPALALAGALMLSAASVAQPPVGVPGQPGGGGRAAPVAEATLPVVPKSSGAFITLKVSDLVSHPDLKPVLAELAKQPETLASVTELLGVSPLEIDRLTLFWPGTLVGNVDDPLLVITTREPFNEARVLKALRAAPVFEDDGRGGRWNAGGGAAAPKAVAPPDFKPFHEPPGKGTLPEPKVPPIPRPFFEQPKLPTLPPLPPPPKQEDSCGPAGDGGPGDPLYYELADRPFEALLLIDERTLLFLPRVRRTVEFAGMALLAATLKKNATGPLTDALAEASKHTFAAGTSLTPLFRNIDRRVPPELVPYTALFATRTAVLTGDLDKGAKLALTLKFDDAASAKRAAPVLEEGIAAVAEKIAGGADELKESRRPFEKSAAHVVSAFATALKKASVKAADTTVTATAQMDIGPALAKALGDLVLAVQSRKKAEERMNNLKQIGLALHNYHDTMGKFPTNVYGPKGELLLSWRVQLLPFLEQDVLYKQFKMDEAWDGPNNKKLIDKMPKVFQAPDRVHAKGETFYQGFVGPDPRKGQPVKGVFGRPWLLDGGKEGLRITEIHDGTSNTLAVIEARSGVTWTKPEDLPFGGAVPPLGEKGWDKTPALRFDGSVLLFPTNLTPDQFWPFVTINGGEATQDPEERGPFGGRPLPLPGATEVAPPGAARPPAAAAVKPPPPPK
jgi:hypothetical protein